MGKRIMNRRLPRTTGLATLAIVLVYSPWLRAEAITQQVQATVERVAGILKELRLRGEAKREERKGHLRQAIYSRFDFAEMGKRSLGNHWRRYAYRQHEFIPAFTHFVEDYYFTQIESYRDGRILYSGERVDHEFAQVDTRVIPFRGSEVFIQYRLHRVQGEWKVYDVLIDNVSLVNNYRSQFNRILTSTSFDELLKKLQQERTSGVGFAESPLDSALPYYLILAAQKRSP